MRNVLYLSLLFISTSVKAQQDSSEKTLEPVIVTAQRMSQKPELVPYTVITVRKQSLNELQPRTTPEALQGVNGVFVQKTNHGGGSPFVRGLAGNQILVLVDGIRLNNSTFRYGPNQYLNTVDAFMADRIEVAKGTGAVQYGSDALGGVIHVLAKDPEFAAGRALHGRILGKYTTRNMEQTARGDLDYSSKTAALTGGVTYRNFGNLYGGDTTGVQNPSGYKEWAFNSKAKFLLSNSVQLTVSSQSLQQQHVPVYHKVRLENFRINEMNRQQRNLHYARLQIRNQNPLWGTVEITTSIQQSTEARRMQKNGSSLLVQEQDKIRTVGVSAAVVSRYKPWWTSNSGIEMYSDNVRSLREETDTENNIKTVKRGLYPDNGKHDNYAVYSLHQFLLKKLVVNAGLRLNVFSIRLQDTSLGEVRFNPQALVGNIALMYPLSTRHHIYANYGTGFRAPNIDDMGSLGRC
jgi:outer membrane receptor protein involved in Fe transport